MPADASPLESVAARENRHTRRRLARVCGVCRGRVLIGLLLGMAGALGIACLIHVLNPPLYRAHGDVAPGRSPGDVVAEYAVAGPVFPLGADCVPALSERVALALVQEHIALGGELAGVAGEEAIRDLAADLAGKIRIVPPGGPASVRVEAAGFKSREQAVRTAEFAVRAYTGMLRESRVEENRAEAARFEQRAAMLAVRLAQAEETVWQFRRDFDFRVPDSVYDEMAAKSATLREVQAEIQQLVARIEGIEAEMGEMGEAENPSPGDGAEDAIRQRRAFLETLRMELRLELAHLEVREGTLRTLHDEFAALMPGLLQRQHAYMRAEADRDHIRRELERVEARIRLLVDADGEAWRRGPVCAAPVPHGLAVSYPLIALAGALAGSVLALGLCTAGVLRDDTVLGIADAEEAAQAEVIGIIPRVRAGSAGGNFRKARAREVDACLVTRYAPESEVREACRTLLTNLESATLGEHPRVFLLTSAVPGEGKTTTAVNLAVTMADRGKRVLAVDADLRRPGVHRILGMERGIGLSEVLREGLEPGAAIRPSHIENLWVMSAGAPMPHPAELVGSSRMAEVLRELGGEFDAVICDTPPLLAAADAALLAAHADACLLVCASGLARRQTVRRAARRLARARLAGVVLNGARAVRSRSYYYYSFTADGGALRRKWHNFF